MVPMRGTDGTLLGVVSVDEPVRLRPTDDEIDVLVAFAEHVAAALEAAHDVAPRLATVRRSRSCSRSRRHSSTLESVDSVLPAVAEGIQARARVRQGRGVPRDRGSGTSPPAPPGGRRRSRARLRIPPPISTRSSPRSSRPKGAGWSITRRRASSSPAARIYRSQRNGRRAAAPGTVIGCVVPLIERGRLALRVTSGWTTPRTACFRRASGSRRSERSRTRQRWRSGPPWTSRR